MDPEKISLIGDDKNENDLATTFANLTTSDWIWIASSSLLFLFVSIVALITIGVCYSLLPLAGFIVGVVFYFFDIGFCRAYGEFLNARTSRFRQILMTILITSFYLFPFLIGDGTVFEGHWYPISAGVAIGAFIFGAGMHLCFGCASGALVDFAMGATNSSVTIVMFFVGSIIGAANFGFWQEFGVGPVVYLLHADPWLGIGLQIFLISTLYFGCVLLEKQVHGTLSDDFVTSISSVKTYFRDRLTKKVTVDEPLPIWIGALALSVCAALVFALKGSPWGISSGLATLGGGILYLFSADVANWDYFHSNPKHLTAITQNWLEDGTVLTDIGFLTSILFIAILTNKFRSAPAYDWVTIPRFAIGGFFLGYGARVAFGCNIGAFYSGAASFSLSAWIWFVCSLVGYGLSSFFTSQFIDGQASAAQ